MKKRILCLLCAAALLCSLCGCVGRGADYMLAAKDILEQAAEKLHADRETAAVSELLEPPEIQTAETDADEQEQSSYAETAELVRSRIYDAVSAGEASAVFTRSEIGDAWEDMDTLVGDAMDELHYNSPEISWKLQSEWSYISSDISVEIVLNYLADETGLRQMQAEIEAQTEAVLLMMAQEEDLWHKLLVLHDYLCTNIVYGSGEYDQSIYGALVDGKCVCAGYANTVSYFLDMLDVENRIIIGTALNDWGEAESHAWNRITVDGTDYYMDITWDDTDEHYGDEELVLHDYFMVSAGSLCFHYADDPAEMLVSADESDGMNYFVHEGYYIASYSREAVKDVIASQLDEGKDVISFCFADIQDYLQADAELNEGGELGRILGELGCVGSYIWYAGDEESAEIYAWTILL